METSRLNIVLQGVNVEDGARVCAPYFEVFLQKEETKRWRGSFEKSARETVKQRQMLKVSQCTSEPEKWGLVLTFIKLEQPGFITAQYDSLHEAPMAQPKVHSHMADKFSSTASPTPSTPVLHPRTDSISSSSCLRTPESSWEMTEMLLFKTVLSL